MRIFRLVAVNSPAVTFQLILFAEPPLYGEFDHRGPQKRQANSDIEHRIFVYINTNSTTFAAQIKCHSKTLDRFKGRK